MRKYQYYNVGDSGDFDGYTANWLAQTFTPEIVHMISKVKIKLFRVGDPGTVIVSIKNTTAGKPSGADLCLGSIEGANITTDTNGEWYEITLGSGYTFDKDTMYAIVVRALDGDASNKVSWRADIGDATFSGGTYCSSSDSGVDWGIISGSDCMFEEWGTGEPAPTAVVWGLLPKSQIDSEKIETAIIRLLDVHSEDETSHLGAGESLQSHKASVIIDHIVDSIIADKIKNGEITNPKISEKARAFTAIVDVGGNGDFTDLQTAIDYVRDLGGGSILILPGTYTQPVDLILYNNVSLIGFDSDTCIITFSASNKGIRAIGDDAPYTAGTISVDNGSTTVNGTGTAFLANVSAGEFILIGTIWAEIDWVPLDDVVIIKNAHNGKTLTDVDYVVATFLEGIEIKNLTIDGLPYRTAKGIYFSYVKNSVISNCFIKDFSNGIYIEGYMERIEISHNKIRVCIQNAIMLGDCHNVMLFYNDISNAYDTGILISNSSRVNILGNQANNCGGHGIKVTGSSDCIITNNTIVDGNADGIKLIIAVSDVIIVNNTVKGNVGTQINDGGTNTQIGHNITE